MAMFQNPGAFLGDAGSSGESLEGTSGKCQKERVHKICRAMRRCFCYVNLAIQSGFNTRRREASDDLLLFSCLSWDMESPENRTMNWKFIQKDSAMKSY